VTRSVARRISVRDMAAKEGCHPSTIRRRLARLHKATGGKAPVMRLDPKNPRSKIVVTTTSLAMADKRLVESERVDAEKVRILEECVRGLEKRLSAANSMIRGLRKALEGVVSVLETRAK
jgi:DNA-binding Lrp family transcriptional regulator